LTHSANWRSEEARKDDREMKIQEVIKWAETKKEPFNSRMISDEFNISKHCASGVLRNMYQRNIIKKIQESNRTNKGLYGALYIFNPETSEYIKIKRDKRNFGEKTLNLIINCFKEYQETPISSKFIQNKLNLSISTVNDCLLELRKKNIIKTTTPCVMKGRGISQPALYILNKERTDNMNETIKAEPTNGKMQKKVLTFNDEILMAVSKGIAGVFNTKLTQIKQEATDEALKLVDGTLKENEALKERVGVLNSAIEIIVKQFFPDIKEFPSEEMPNVEYSLKNIANFTIPSVLEKVKKLQEEIKTQGYDLVTKDSEIQKLQENKAELESLLMQFQNSQKKTTEKELDLQAEINRIKATCQRATEEARKLKEENKLLQTDSDKITIQSAEVSRLSGLLKDRDILYREKDKTYHEQDKKHQLLKDKFVELQKEKNILQNAFDRLSPLEKENNNLLEQLREERRKNQALTDKMRKYFEDDLMAA
jgi:predicted transcriptional regulator